MSSNSASRVVLVVLAISVFCGGSSAQEPVLQLSCKDGNSQIVMMDHGGAVLVHETPSAVSGLALRTVPGSPALAATWDELDPNGGRPAPHFALSTDGRRFQPAERASYDLLLRYRRFDPVIEGEPAIPSALRAEPGARLWIVQYWTQGLEDYRDVVRALGGEIHLFLANHANVIEADGATIAALRAQSFVRWVGPFHPAYKLEEELLLEHAGATPAPASRQVNLLTTRRGPRGHEPVMLAIASIGGRVMSDSVETNLMSAVLTPEQTLALARVDGVQWIDRWSPPEDDMDIAREFHGANYVETNGGFTGTGVRVEVLDGGCDTTHPDLQNYVLHGANAVSSHGTCTSGIVCGTGSGNAAARGCMPNATLVIGDYDTMTNRYNHTADLQNSSLAYKCVLQSNSWGNTLTTAYTSISQDMDLILFDFQRISILQSQSNNGNQSSRPQAWAKNIISVGGIRHVNTLTTADDSWTGGASIGPAADGRIKPDISSFYDSTLCTDRVGASGYTSTNYYSSFGGTSGATPICAGHVGLLYQMWSAATFGNPAPAPTVFENRPNNTTMKALVINTATQWPYSADLSRVHQGWGHPDLKAAWDLRNNIYIVDETDVLTNLGSTVHPLNVAAGATLKATLVYRDNPGTTSSTQHRINNLNLKVTSPSGTIYWGNNGLGAGAWSTSGGTANTLDTVENVFVQTPQVGTWLVEVIAAELNQDTHVETPGLDCDYALVVSGVTLGPPPPPSANFSASPLAGIAPLTVTFTNLSTAGATGFLWDFGDTGTSTAASPSHQYTAPGTYTVSLTTTWPSGSDNETKTGYIVVDAPPAPPAITNVAPQNVTAFLGGTITLTGTGFAGATQVNVGGIILTAPLGFTVLGGTTISFTAPTAPALGSTSVTVTTANGTSLPATFDYVETSPAKMTIPTVTITGATVVWAFGAGVNDTGLVLVSGDPTTFDFGTPFQILLNFSLIGGGVCNAVGIGSFAVVVPPGLSGITFYSQVAAIEDVSGALSVTPVGSTLILI